MLDSILQEMQVFGDNQETSEYLLLVSKQPVLDGEVHHILPQSIFPEYKNCSWNKVKLSREDHYRAHELLPSMLSGMNKTKMVFAWNMMRNRLGVSTTSEEYSKLKQQYTERLVRRLTTNNPMHVEEFANKLRGVKRPDTSERLKNNNPSKLESVKQIKRDKWKIYWSDPDVISKRCGVNHPGYGKPRSEEQKRRHSETMKGRPSPLKGKERPELKGKMSGDKNPMARSVVIDGVTYKTLTEAAEHYKVTIQAIAYWTKNGTAFYVGEEPNTSWKDGRSQSVVIKDIPFETMLEAAKHFDVTTTTITNWIKAGKGYKISTRGTTIPRTKKD